MKYHVKHKETGEEKTLSHLEVNDMVYGDAGQVIVFDTSMVAYELIDDEDLLSS
ncbi:hypothetical protein [Paenibacillus sp. Soil766]|uniref:hypothetical protein n=1 Tax=Paenibacillus sp. Soil766 TaxID=1736404 RepID=UPI000A4F3B04|nr:hypothetical protein [Paenibacillus sp. Soil766]